MGFYEFSMGCPCRKPPSPWALGYGAPRPGRLAARPAPPLLAADAEPPGAEPRQLGGVSAMVSLDEMTRCST